MIEVNYNGSKYKYDENLGSRPWVNSATNVAVPVSLYSELRQIAIDSGVNASTFTTSGVSKNSENKTKKTAKKSSFIKIF
tara:strand:- start:116 stop:355 length:240 start_codon:yes stop_codon:yes gene_type:complete